MCSVMSYNLTRLAHHACTCPCGSCQSLHCLWIPTWLPGLHRLSVAVPVFPRLLTPHPLVAGRTPKQQAQCEHVINKRLGCW